MSVDTTAIAHAQDVHQAAEHAAHADYSPMLFIILALFIGVFTRHFLKKLPFPFTVLLLLFGLFLGTGARWDWFHHINLGATEFSMVMLDDAVTWSAHLDPHMLFYIFLPILIFEAAFAMDVHTFRRSLPNAIILAIPGIILAMVLTGGVVFMIARLGFGLDGWDSWTLALMFGAVISATDPVAVVALLKDLGASKKLGTLIEGESLLNDGTAIVLFMAFYAPMVGESTSVHPVLEFFRVALGGTLVGIVVGWITLRWIGKVRSDALVEISLVLASAYLTFFVAENFFHVSGVLALVTLGIILGGVGRTRVSPKVEHFMHEFWELAGFMANCLIFVIVGVVVALRINFSWNDMAMLAVVYVAIHVVRAIVMAIFYPVMKRAGYGLPPKDAVVVWYGALRGAIGLALALIVMSVPDEVLAPEVKDQFLFLTAGVVTLTLLINATTIKYIVNGLGLTKLSPAKEAMIDSAHDYMHTSARNHSERLKGDRYLKKARWSEVSDYIPFKVVDVKPIRETEVVAELRRQLLEKEKSSYWHQFKHGMLGPAAVRKLSDAIDVLLDQGGMTSLAARQDLEEYWQPPARLEMMMKVPLLKRVVERAYLDWVALSYDCAHGFIESQQECLKLIASLDRAGESEDVLKLLEDEVNENIIQGQTFIRNLRKEHPEVVEAVATRQAVRALLRYEGDTIERLKKKGQIDGVTASRMESELEARYKKLTSSPPRAMTKKTRPPVKKDKTQQELEQQEK